MEVRGSQMDVAATISGKIKVSLEIHGRKRTFSEKQLVAILKEHFSYKVTRANLARVPTEGKLFKVNHLKIDRSKFEDPMRDEMQERTRQIIQEAFDQVDKHPENYSSAFYTLIPKKESNGFKSFEELEAYAKDLGGYIANWVEQALEWAQRISNGESWEALCNDEDTANCYRLVIWMYGEIRLVGDSCKHCYGYPVSHISRRYYYTSHSFKDTVPLVVIKKK